MIINTPISLGELVDKISILLIKEKNIKDEKKLILIVNELRLLKEILNKAVHDNIIEKYLNQLVEINTKLWKIEDNIRDCEKNKKFGQDFIDLARSVYINNDKRSEIKFEINTKFNSKIIEVKSYKKY